MRNKFHVLGILLFLSAASVPLVYGFDGTSPIINPQPVLNCKDIILCNKFVPYKDMKSSHKKGHTLIRMKSKNDNGEESIIDDECQHSKRSIFQSIRMKWRNNHLKNKNKNDVTRKRHRIAAIATCLFAWTSPRTAQLLKMSHSPIVAHADTTTSSYQQQRQQRHWPPAVVLKGKKHGHIEVKQVKNDAQKKSMVRNTLLVTAAGTGCAIGQVANAKLQKREEDEKEGITRGEKEFNEIMGIDSMSKPEVKEANDDQTAELGIDEITQVTADIIPLQNFQLGAGIDTESANDIINETPENKDEENKDMQALKQKNIMEVSARISAEDNYKKVQTALHKAREEAKSAVNAKIAIEAQLKEKDKTIRNMKEEMKISTATKRAALALATANEEALSQAEEKNKIKDGELSKTQAEHDVILAAAEALYGADKSALDKASRDVVLAQDAMAVAEVRALMAEQTLKEIKDELKREKLFRTTAEARARAGEEDFRKLQKRAKAEADARAVLEAKFKKQRDADVKIAKVEMKKEIKALDEVIAERDAAIKSKSVLESKVHQQENALYKAELKAKTEERARRTAEAMEKVMSAAVEAGSAAHETALCKAEEELKFAIQEKLDAEARAEEAEKRLNEEMERANLEARARATAEAMTMASEEDYRKLKMKLKAEIDARKAAEKRSRNLELKIHEIEKTSGAFDELEKKAEEFKDIFHVSKEKKKMPKH